MSDIAFELDEEAVRDGILASPEMERFLGDLAKSICPKGYTVDTKVGKNRANARISCGDGESRKDNLENNTLEKLIRTKVSI